MADSDDPQDDDKVALTRRRLLRIAIYTPPTVIGIIQLNNAGCAPPASCPPNVCQPNSQCGPNTCNPVINPCNPQNCNPNG